VEIDRYEQKYDYYSNYDHSYLPPPLAILSFSKNTPTILSFPSYYLSTISSVVKENKSLTNSTSRVHSSEQSISFMAPFTVEWLC